MASFGQLARGHVELMNRACDAATATTQLDARVVVRLSHAQTLALQKLTSLAIDVVAQINALAPVDAVLGAAKKRIYLGE